ncbi:MAG: tyrosine-type recombinase/integrase [Puia sp.]
MRNKDIRFFLKDPKSRESLVYMLYACKDGILKYSTGKKIQPKDWSKENQLPSNKKHYLALYNQIQELTGYVKDYVRLMDKARKLVKNIPLYNYLAAHEGKPLREEIGERSDYFAKIQEFIDDAKAGRLAIINSGAKDGNLYNHETLKRWKLVKGILQRFDPNLDWEITMDTYTRFIAWCNEPAQNFRPNYTGTIIKIWKVFMNLGLHYKLHDCHVHQDRAFRKPSEKSYENKVYLTEAEIEQLIAVPLEGKMKEVRDAFVFNCFCGLRISDMATLTMDNIQDGKIINVNRKTNKKVAIPLHRHNKRLIAEYNGIPPVYHQNTINEVIKPIAKDAGITAVKTTPK